MTSVISNVLLPFVLALLLIHVLTTASNVKVMSINAIHAQEDNDSGTALNCGHEELNITWTPKDFCPDLHITFRIHYRVPHYIDGGFINASIHYHADPNPIVEYADDFDCEMMQQFGLGCPISNKAVFTLTKTFEDIGQLKPYFGSYDVLIQVWNQDNLPLLCVNISLVILKCGERLDNFY
ncbi:uncharacterized protein LOC131927025 [Physella acuta]|uniref:uncharacterized protein LOC131927025 n=1 Tax=Physella acuta TaxID=109671 RepID=UPI0027DD4122|nr:uncharacterized protein LOC131927025 [Physella acuta]